MIRATFVEMRKRRRLVAGVVFFALYLGLYLLIDRLAGGYAAMAAAYGWPLVAANILLDIVLAAATAFLMTMSAAFAALAGREGNGTLFGGAAVLFGMLTYGCTPCVVAFFASIGVTFSVAVLPFMGLPYKFISLGLVAVGIAWLLLEIRRGKCKRPKAAPGEDDRNR
jgi:hypothetical protein